MGTTKPSVTLEVTLEEAYFFLRTATWHQEEFAEYIELHQSQAFEEGYDDGREYGSREANEQGWEQEYERGYELGHKEGSNEGFDEGYKEGYADGSREEDYNTRRY
jgi:flagellar biosynthesis/type III secretory pathway protein FliH